MDAANPPVNAIQAALRKITETLAYELAQPTDVGPNWSDFEWLIARAVVAIHGVSPLLAAKLHWEGRADWQQFLRQQRAHTLSRHERIQGLLKSVDARARDAGVAVIALKGAALHAAGVYAPGERPMADIDLLVRDCDIERAAHLLTALGFVQSPIPYWKHLTFSPRQAQSVGALGEHADNPLKIELHDRIQEILPSRRTEITGLVFPAAARPGLNSYPSNTALMAHVLLHAAGAMAYRSLRMLNLHDIALLSRQMKDPEWEQFLRLAGSHQGFWWALPPLTLTARYYPSAIPAEVLATLRPACRWLLRRLAAHQSLSDVSLSYLWLEAFPGLPWARSIGELSEHVAGRIARATQLLKARRSSSTATVSAAAGGVVPEFSRTSYILRSLISRQARPETMGAVRAVLAPPIRHPDTQPRR